MTTVADIGAELNQWATAGEPDPDVLAQVAAQGQPRGHKHASPLRLARHIDTRTGRTAALDCIDTALVDLIDGRDEHNAVMIMMPPQEGKSTLCARRLPEWLLQDDPSLRIAIVSYEQEKAMRWGRDIKNDIAHAGADLDVRLREDSQAAGRWETPEGGGVYSVGIGGALTGQAVDVLIIDDPVKDRATAESERVRNTTWDWWENVALTRLAPGAKVVFIMTRWHEDDLAGRIMARPSPLSWKTVTIPAIALDSDPLGREPGTELQSVRHRAPGYFHHLRATLGPYSFSSIYQQTPTAAEGNFFRRATFRYWRAAPPWTDGRQRIDLEGRLVTLEDGWLFATVDIAASEKTSADYTVISVWMVAREGDLVLLDRARAQVAEHDHFALAGPLFDTWGHFPLYVERGFFAKTLVTEARDAGVPVVEVVADKDKVTRAVPAAGRVHAGRVWFPAEAPWLDDWCDELAGFPNATHDDQVDTLSYAVRVQVADWAPPKDPPRRGLDPHERSVATAAASATGQGEGIDLMNVQW